MPFMVDAVRRQFPILRRKIGGHPLAYLDNAATTQKPQAVLDRMRRFYEEENANINRGVHALAEEATAAYHQARKSVAAFIGTKRVHEIIFTRNTTESINIVARSYGALLHPGDRIALTTMEHHSNIVPWQQLQESRGIGIDWIPVSDEGVIDEQTLERILKKGRTKLLTVTGLSNVLGAPTPIGRLTTLAHAHGAMILVDGAQLVGHETVDVQDSDIDFFAFSGHKLYAPTGIGVLYGKEAVLEQLPPFLGGGDMIGSVTTEGFTTAELPRKFEAGTPAIAESIGLAAALDWLTELGIEDAHAYTKSLIAVAHRKLASIKGLRILGPSDPTKRLGCVSFTVDGIHAHDLTDLLGREGICLRAGHHCTQPLHKQLGIVASSRLSVAVYNTEEELDRCVKAIERAKEKLLGQASA